MPANFDETTFARLLRRLPSSATLCAAVAALVVATAGAASSSGIVLRGVDSQNFAPFTLSRPSDVIWTCSGCAQGNFIFETSEAPGIVNALNHTHGVSYLDKGRYTGVSVIGTGAWTIRLLPSSPRPVARSYRLTGVDSTNVKPFTLTHGSQVIWSCPGCASGNFIFETSESPGVVNALDHTHGSSYLDKGHYTGVSVTATGSWTIVLR